MIKVYPAILHEEGSFWVEFPDLPGCHACGESLEETMQLAQEALGLYLATLIEEGQELPARTAIERVESNDLVSYVSVDVNEYRRDTKAVKKTVSLPGWLAKEAEEKHLSLSKSLQDSLKAQLGFDPNEGNYPQNF